jgi:hypothetical protein
MQSGEVLPDARPQTVRPWRRRLRILLSVIMVAVAAVAAALGWLMMAQKSSPPYRMAWDKVRHDPQVMRALGDPVRDTTWFPTTEIDSDGRRGDARLGFDVAGPQGQGHVSAQARQLDGRWGLARLEVVVGGEKRLLLDTGSEESGASGGSDRPDDGDAPKWQPDSNVAKPPPEASPGRRPGASAPKSDGPGGSDAPRWDPPKLPEMH